MNAPDGLPHVGIVSLGNGNCRNGAVRRQAAFDLLLRWNGNADIPLDNGLAGEGITLVDILFGKPQRTPAADIPLGDDHGATPTAALTPTGLIDLNPGFLRRA